MRPLLPLLLLVVVLAPATLAGVALVFDITDADPTSAQALANSLVANYASYNLAITNVTVLGTANSVGVPPLGTPPPTGPTGTGTATGTPGGPSPPKGSSYQDWAPALISCIIGLAIGVAVILIALIKRRANNANNNQKMVIGLCIMLLCGPNGTYSLTRTYSNCRILLPDIDYRLYWEVNGNTLQAAMQAKTQGWLGMGISTSQTVGSYMDSAGVGPYGSDITMGYMGSDCPNGCAFDYWTTLHAMPNKDANQNVTFVAAQKNSTHTAIEFNRPMTTRGDADQDKNIPTNAEVMVIFASNVAELPAAQGTQFSYHGSNRNAMKINFGATSDCSRAYANLRVLMYLSSPFAFFNYQDFFVQLGSKLSVGPERFQFVAADDTSFSCPNCIIDDMVMPSFPLKGTAGETNYICYDFTFDSSATYHAVRFDPIVSPGSVSVVHHMILYSLKSPSGKVGFWDCSSMPASAAPLSVWAVGAGPFILPDNVGFKVGKDSVVYATLQMHYNNPALQDFTDNSGFRVYRTPTLRPLNGAWGFLGQGTSSINIPAGIAYPPGYTVSGNCPSSITNLWAAYGDVHIFAYAMHAHGLGRKIQTDHWRSGAKVATYVNDPYSFSFQHLVMGDWTVKQGDTLNTTCWYDSSTKSTSTRGGEASSQEMCYAIVAFYCPDPCPATFGGGACIV